MYQDLGEDRAQGGHSGAVGVTDYNETSTFRLESVQFMNRGDDQVPGLQDTLRCVHDPVQSIERGKSEPIPERGFAPF
jgi:hypothetical protein